MASKIRALVSHSPWAGRVVVMAVSALGVFTFTVAFAALTASPAGADMTTNGFNNGFGVDPFAGMDPTGGAGAMTGSLLGTDALSASNSYGSVTDLALSSLMDQESMRAAEQARADLERRRRAAMVGQTEVGPDGCPVSAPPRGIQTSKPIDIGDVCARSVAQARTPEAAKAIKYALVHLGLPYSQPKRNQEGYYDCSSFYSRAYEETGLPIISKYNGGWPLVTWHFTGTGGFSLMPFVEVISFDQALPGDAVLFADAEHMAMKLVDGLIAEAPNSREVTRVKELWWSNGRAAYIVPERV